MTMNSVLSLQSLKTRWKDSFLTGTSEEGGPYWQKTLCLFCCSVPREGHPTQVGPMMKMEWREVCSLLLSSLWQHNWPNNLRVQRFDSWFQRGQFIMVVKACRATLQWWKHGAGLFTSWMWTRQQRARVGLGSGYKPWRATPIIYGPTF